MKPGIELIAEERERQIKEEGWTAEHDDEHPSGALADAAIVYAATEPIYFKQERTIGGRADLPVIHFENLWPFSARWYKPADRTRNLVKAGALIAAEIDRLQRVP